MLEWKSADFVQDGTFENAAVGIAHVALDGSFLRVNRKLQDIVGYDRDELLALTFADITVAEDLIADLDRFEALKAGKIDSYEMEKRYCRRDGEIIWVLLTVGLQKDGEGRPLYCISVIEDITGRKRDQDALQTLVHELNHRVKNTLSTVQALAHLTFDPERPVAETFNLFFDRLQSLSVAHDLLTEEKWAGAGIRPVIEAALGPFDSFSNERLRLSGPNFTVAPRVAISTAMAINELATNSVKYGALASEAGIVTLDWTMQPDGRFDLVWRESGGPAVVPPVRQGFGTSLLQRIFPGDLKADAAIDYAPEGVVYTLRSADPAGLRRGGDA